jgi:oligopeptide/dipeptide ABC transporter ATP-binding protein
MTVADPGSPAELLALDDVVVRLGRGRNVRTILDRVSLTVAKGETVGLVGESGSGKSTLARAVVGLLPIASGQIRFGHHPADPSASRKRADRRRLAQQVQLVFQDPLGSLNPSRTIGQSLRQVFRVRDDLSSVEISRRIAQTLEQVGLAARSIEKFPSEFSGGQRQRVGIARALLAEPRLIICDESVAALDLSVQAQIINLLIDLRSETGIGYLFISHDLAVIRHIADRVVVLYGGEVMESGSAHDVLTAPRHPYSKTLIDASPIPDPKAQRARHGRDRAAEIRARPTGQGCPFATRCPHVLPICAAERPAMTIVEEGRLVACHLVEATGDPAHGATGREDSVSSL